MLETFPGSTTQTEAFDPIPPVTEATASVFAVEVSGEPTGLPGELPDRAERMTGDRGALNISFGGLRRAFAVKRLERAVDSADSWDESATEHREAARSVLEHKLPASADKNAKIAHAKRRVDNRPITRSGVRQAKRAGMRLRNNMDNAVENYNIDQVFSYPEGKTEEGDVIPEVKIGTRAHTEMVAGERLSRGERKGEKHAAALFSSNRRKVKKNVGKVRRSAEGTDIPGRVIGRMADRSLDRADRLAGHIEELDRRERGRRR